MSSQHFLGTSNFTAAGVVISAKEDLAPAYENGLEEVKLVKLNLLPVSSWKYA